jgi:uncharacterized membrane protein YfcA
VINLFLFLVAALGGALNSVAGGGSFLTLPALLYAGIAPVAANATSTFAMWPASVSSAIAYRREIKTPASWLVMLGAVSLAGGFVGAVLLVRTSDARFMRLLPYLMLVAATTFTFGSRRRDAGRGFRPGHHGSLALTAALHVPIAIYGGYFGGGMGIMMLATYALAGMTDIHEMNGLKAVLGAAINGLALLDFVLSGIVAWQQGLLMAAGGIIGGYGGAAVARRIERGAIRVFVIVIGWTMTVYFFLR